MSRQLQARQQCGARRGQIRHDNDGAASGPGSSAIGAYARQLPLVVVRDRSTFLKKRSMSTVFDEVERRFSGR
jgi:hypothetical protein